MMEDRERMCYRLQRGKFHWCYKHFKSASTCHFRVTVILAQFTQLLLSLGELCTELPKQSRATSQLVMTAFPVIRRCVSLCLTTQ